MKGAKKQLGAWGENLAATHLETIGLTIVCRNWRCLQGEIDLVARSKTDQEIVFHFVEVKTRRGRAMGLPEEAITPHKAQTLLTCALLYLAEQELEEITWQIDLVAIELDRSGKLLRCEYIPHCVTGG